MEAFCSDHQVNIDEILYDWPATKFEALYEAFSKRKIVEELSHRRALEVAAVWGNPNLDSEKDPKLRSGIQEKIDERYSNAISKLYSGAIQDESDEPDWENDAFWAAAKRGIEKRKLPELGE